MVNKRFLVVALLLFLVVGISNPAAMAASESQIVFSDVAKKVGFPVYFPTFIPEGFKHDAAKDSFGGDYSIHFAGPEGTIEIFGGRGDVGDIKVAKTIPVGDSRVSISEPMNGRIVAWWHAGDYDYAIESTGITVDDMELIADSIILATGNLPNTGVDGRWFALAFILIAIGVALIIFNPRPGTGR